MFEKKLGSLTTRRNAEHTENQLLSDPSKKRGHTGQATTKTRGKRICREYRSRHLKETLELIIRIEANYWRPSVDYLESLKLGFNLRRCPHFAGFYLQELPQFLNVKIVDKSPHVGGIAISKYTQSFLFPWQKAALTENY